MMRTKITRMEYYEDVKKSPPAEATHRIYELCGGVGPLLYLAGKILGEMRVGAVRTQVGKCGVCANASHECGAIWTLVQDVHTAVLVAGSTCGDFK